MGAKRRARRRAGTLQAHLAAKRSGLTPSPGQVTPTQPARSQFNEGNAPGSPNEFAPIQRQPVGPVGPKLKNMADVLKKRAIGSQVGAAIGGAPPSLANKPQRNLKDALAQASTSQPAQLNQQPGRLNQLKTALATQPGGSGVQPGQLSGQLNASTGPAQPIQGAGSSGITGLPAGPNVTEFTAENNLRNKQIAPGGDPSRSDLAQRSFDLIRKQSDVQFDKDLRKVGQKAAAFGRIGSGVTTSDVGDVAQRRNEFLGRAQRDLALNTAGALVIGSQGRKR